MTELSLLSKIYNTNQFKQIDKILRGFFEDLDVTANIEGTIADKWVLLSITGEDEQIATNILDHEAGICPKTIENLKKFSIQKGYVAPIKAKDTLLLDVGVYEPKTTYAKINLKNLQKNLANNQDTPLQKITTQWGICENLPLQIKILNINPQDNQIDAELAPQQITKYLSWQNSLLDRLIILGASKEQISIAVEQERLSRDIIDTESLGLFEHALVCKLGTDATGLIGRIGKRLRKAKFVVYNPKKLQPNPNSA